jgi:four helix bundle protein
MQNQNPKFKTDLKSRAYKYSINVIEFLDALPNDISTSVITNQLLRSATSIGANIVEAKGSGTKKDFTHFYRHSLKSANESLYWFGLLRDAKKIKTEQLLCLLKETQELAKILASSILTLEGKR